MKSGKSLWRLAKIAVMDMILIGSQSKKHSRTSDPNENSGSGSSKHGERKGKTKCPSGHVSVFVGEERKQYFIPIAYLSHHLFVFLLEKTRHESGYKHPDGGIVVMCDVEVFGRLIHIIQNKTSDPMDVAAMEDLLKRLDVTECSGPLVIE